MTGRGAFFISGHGDANPDDSCSGSGTVAALVVLSVTQERSLSAAALGVVWFRRLKFRRYVGRILHGVFGY